MEQKKFLSPLMDEKNVQMVEVEAEALSAEDAYRVLAEIPLEPVDVEEQQ